MEKLISKKGFNLPKSQNIQTFYEVEIEPLEKGLYRVRSGNFKGLLKERQLAELREQIAAEQQEDKDFADAKLLIEKKRQELQAKAEKIYNETQMAFNMLSANLNKGTEAITQLQKFETNTNKIFNKPK